MAFIKAMIKSAKVACTPMSVCFRWPPRHFTYQSRPNALMVITAVANASGLLLCWGGGGGGGGVLPHLQSVHNCRTAQLTMMVDLTFSSISVIAYAY